MSILMGLRHRLRALLDPGAHARDLEEEMRLHRELERMHEGDTRDTAVRFGNTTYYREEVRRMTLYGLLDGVRQDARYAWRSTVRNPGFTLMVVLTLALGIGVNAASFSVLDLLFLREPAGVTRPDEVRRVHIEHFNTGDGVPFTSQALNYPMYQQVVAAIGDSTRAALYTTEDELRMGTSPRDPKLRGVYASANYFPLLGARAVLGRVYTAHEDRLDAPVPVAVVSHRFWRSRLGGDSAAIGRPIDIDGTRHTVVGVLDPAFGGVDLQAADVWMPLASIPVPSWVKGPWWKEPFNMTRFRALFRPAPGVPESQVALGATARLRALNRELHPRRPDTLVNVFTGSIIEGQGPGKPRAEHQISTRLSGVAVLVMLIACANVINLLLARAVRRRHEFSIRLALGISRSRMIRMLTTETVLLALLATGPALLAAWWGGGLLRSLLLPDIEWYATALTGRVALFALGSALIAGLVAGIVPALQAGGRDLAGALKASPRGGGGHRSRLRGTLVVAQAALTLVLLTGAALFVRSLGNVQRLDIGYDATRLVFGNVEFARGEAPPAAVRDAALRDIGERLAGRAGVESAARTVYEPMRGMSWIPFFTGRDSLESFEHSMPTVTSVTPGFFGTVGIAMKRGRTFGGRDGGVAPPEVVVNEALAARLWPGQDAVGQCMHLKKADAPCHTVVGVVENARQNELLEPEGAFQFYVAVGDSAGSRYGTTIVLRASGPTDAASAALRGALRSAFPAGEPVVRTMAETLAPQYRPWRLGARLFTATGVLALVVALVGIYSTVSYGVSQRLHEFGVRIALGARLGDLLRQVVGEGVRVVLVGVVAGALLAVAAGRLVSSLLYGVEASDPVTIGAVALLMLAAAALAAIVPAWRASRTDPVTALRAE